MTSHDPPACLCLADQLACQSYKTCPNTAAVKSALVSYLKPVMPSIRISVAPTSLEPLVVDLYSDDSQVNYSGLDTCPHVATFQVFVVTDDLQTYKVREDLTGHTYAH